MSKADEKVKSTLRKPPICAEWSAVVPSYEERITLSSKFYLKSVQYQFRLEFPYYTLHDEGVCYLHLQVVRSDDQERISEFFGCTVIAVSEGTDQLLSPCIRKRINIECGILWEIEISSLEFERLQGKTISFLVVLEQDGGSTQEEADCYWSLSPKSLHSLCTDFAKLLDDPRTADVKLVCGGVTIPAHGSILSARSEVFQKMLEKRTGSIKIPDIEPQVIKEFLRYIYTGRLPDEMTVEKASRLYEAGDKYNVRSLVAECVSYLGSSLTVDNACDVLVLADSHDDSDLKKRATDYIALEEIPLHFPSIWNDFSDEHPKLAHEAVLGAYEFLKSIFC